MMTNFYYFSIIGEIFWYFQKQFWWFGRQQVIECNNNGVNSILECIISDIWKGFTNRQQIKFVLNSLALLYSPDVSSFDII